MPSSRAATISPVTSVLPGPSFDRCAGVGGDLGHQHVELPLESGQQLVELAAGLGLGPGHAHRRLGLVDGAGHLHHGGVLGHPAPVEEARGPVVAGPRVDLQHAWPHRAMLNDGPDPAGHAQPAAPPVSLVGYGRRRRIRIELPPGRPRAGASSSTAPWAPTSSCRSSTADDFGGPDLEGCNEILVVTRPDAVDQVHRSFFEVGCDVVETDTFGAFAPVLAEYGLADRVRELNLAAAGLARKAADDFSTPDRPRWVAGSIGPGTKFPTLGQIRLRRPPRRLRGAVRRPHRGRRRPHHHRDGLRPPPGQGGHQRGPAGHASGRASSSPSSAR